MLLVVIQGKKQKINKEKRFVTTKGKDRKIQFMLMLYMH